VSTVYDPKKIRPNKEDWIIVLADRRKTTLASGIILTDTETGAEKVTEGAGTIVRVGKGPKIDSEKIKEGDRIVYRTFLKYANRIPTEDRNDEFFFMAVDDVLGILSPGVEVGVFSRAKK
jgi:co-chaperonin GroES (HSP10)